MGILLLDQHSLHPAVDLLTAFALKPDLLAGLNKPANRFWIIPCSPSKISLSDVVATRRNDMLLPTGFDTDSGGRLAKEMARIESLIPKDCRDTDHFKEIPVELGVAIIDAIRPTLVFPDESAFDWEAMTSIFRYYASKTHDQVLLTASTNRQLSRSASGDKSGLSVIGTKLRDLSRDPARSMPALILLRQEGTPALGWKAGPFWWPVIASSAQSLPCIFAGRVAI